MGKRLEFIQFLTKTSKCKTLKESQINILWECLVVNAFSEDERDQFFMFCTEILTAVQVHQFKMQQKAKRAKENQGADGERFAGELLFEDDCLEMIFFEILLRLDFKGTECSGSSFT